jgi:hypothetical protein
MDMYCTTTAQVPIVARVHAEPFEPQSRATLHVNTENVHLFAPGTYGRNLTRPVTEEHH